MDKTKALINLYKAALEEAYPKYLATGDPELSLFIDECLQNIIDLEEEN